ncbi:meiotic nuclear division protein 1 homolog [Parasteatoda tepidariorum]|uniref:Meiotic nuclear division protein 1 homolog n=1 Tax=Parasteatoda tepidariorum TaxID=114398 RepID=A0A2L2YLE1_PARTP|nr:meiotic nuclear division protein 1 homolog [Parasteatoda tepidariorum]
MSRKKGLSVEEKRTKMQEIFFEKKDVFQLKDLEKLAPKEKGIVAQSVKDVLQSLVDDGLVDSEKIGTSIYFWAFPSKAHNNRKRKIEDLNSKIDEARKKIKLLNKQIETAKSGKEESDNRETILKELVLAENTIKELKSEIEKHKECDPEVLQQVKSDIVKSTEAANRWTDNIFGIKSWCKKKFFMEESTLNKQFGIPEELDYLE